MFFSKSTNGFYDATIHGDSIPGDAVEITRTEHLALLDAQSSGKVIQADVNGMPVAVDPVPQSADEIRAGIVAPAGKIRRALNQMGLRSQVEAIVSAADQDTKDFWEYEITYRRMHPVTLSVIQAIGKTPEEADDLFNLANSLG